MSTNKAHPHGPSEMPCAECGGSVEEFTIPNAIWNAVIRHNGKEHDREYLCLDCWHSALAKHLGVNPQVPTLLQGHTMEQWEFMRKQGFDCEFSDNPDFNERLGQVHIAKLVTAFLSNEFSARGYGVFKYCRPRRAKGIKQPWFGGECPVDQNAWVIVFRRDGLSVYTNASHLRGWRHTGGGSDIIAFIEL